MKKITELTAELERMRNENSVLRSLLTQNGGAAPGAPPPLPHRVPLPCG